MAVHDAALPPWALAAYLVSGVLFILSLRGLSSPTTSARGNRQGMIGMLIAVLTTMITLAPIPPGHWWPRPTQQDLIVLAKITAAIALGGAIGLLTARRIAMTAMPQLVAAFHSLVGMAAVLVGVAAYLGPATFGILDPQGEIHLISRIEMGLGVAIGAITFSGSVIAFLKLAGMMRGSPILLPARHFINLGTLAAILGLIAWFSVMPTTDSASVFWLVVGAVVPHRLPADHPDRRGGHAGGGLDAQLLFGLGGGGDGFHAA